MIVWCRWKQLMRCTMMRNLDQRYGSSLPTTSRSQLYEPVSLSEQTYLRTWMEFPLQKYSFISILWTTNGPNQYKNFDYVVIAGGKWFLKKAIYHENNTVTGCHNCNGKNLTEVGLETRTAKHCSMFLTSWQTQNTKRLYSSEPPHQTTLRIESGSVEGAAIGQCPSKRTR